MERVALDGSEAAAPVGEAASDPDPDQVFTVSVYLADQPGVPTAKDVADEFVRSFGLAVVSVDDASHRVQLSGTVQQLEQAFGVRLQQRRLGGEPFITYEGPIHVPADVAPSVIGVLGLDRRPIAGPRSST